MEWYHAMFSRRISTAALLLALFGAACGSGGSTHVAAKAGDADAVPAAAVVETTTTTAAADVTTTTEAPAATPAATATPAVTVKPKTASIEVDYQPAENADATATITGPNGTHTKSLASGAAIFGSLPAGSYDVTVSISTPSDDPTIGDALVVLNGNTIDVGPGDHATVSCDDSGCSGVLNA